MESAQKNRNAKLALYIMNTFFLLVHGGLLLLFTALHVTFMAYVNVASVSCYIVCYYLIKKEKIIECNIATYVEILVHSFLAVVCVGWDFGFQLFFVGCIADLFFADYFAVQLGKRHIRGFGLSLISIAAYIVSLLIVRFYGSFYHLDEDIAFIGTIFNSMIALVFVTLVFSMLTEAASRYEAELSKQATHDKLTGLLNRHYLVEFLSGIYSSGDVERHWIAMLDIDNFKGINDKYGHLCGDYILQTVAEMIKESCGERIVCRWGGEEFLIVGADLGSDSGETGRKETLLENIRKNIADKEFIYEGTVINLTVTIGAAHYQSGQTVSEWINTADDRLYFGKRTGKNRIIDRDI